MKPWTGKLPLINVPVLRPEALEQKQSGERTEVNVISPETSRSLRPQNVFPRIFQAQSCIFPLPSPLIGSMWHHDPARVTQKLWSKTASRSTHFPPLVSWSRCSVNLQQACQLERKGNDMFLENLHRGCEFLKNILHLCPFFRGGVLFSYELVFVS